MDQTNPWRDAIASALFDKQLPPLGDNESPEDALQRLLRAEGEWALMNHKPGQVSPYRRSDTEVLEEQKWLTGDWKIYRDEMAAMDPDQWERLNTARPHGVYTTNFNADMARTVATTAQEIQARMEPAFQQASLSMRDRFIRRGEVVLDHLIPELRGSMNREFSRTVINSTFGASPNIAPVIEPFPWPFSTVFNDSQTQQVPPQAGDPQHDGVGQDQRDPHPPA